MHLIIAFAAPLSDAGQQAVRGRDWRYLAGLLSKASRVREPAMSGRLATEPAMSGLLATEPAMSGRLATEPAMSGLLATEPELSFTPVHERLFAQAVGIANNDLADGLCPLAAHWAREEGLQTQIAATPEGWALLTPCHWAMGTAEASLLDPADLQLDEPTARELFTALAEHVAATGWPLHYAAPTRWYTQHASLAQLPTASLDRVIGRNVDRWLNPGSAIGSSSSNSPVSAAAPVASPQTLRQFRDLRRLQSELQMLLYTHPANERRERQGLLPINSVWFSGTGPATELSPPSNLANVKLDRSLAKAALAGDWPRWLQAWDELERGPIAQWAKLASEVNSTTASPAQLSLCGERGLASFSFGAQAPVGLWRRLGLAVGLGPKPLNIPALFETL